MRFWGCESGDCDVCESAPTSKVLRITGGGIVKKHMTKQERLKSLQMRSIESVSKDKELNLCFDIPSVDMPHGLQNLLQPVREKLDNAKAMSSQDLFVNIFAQLTDDKLKQLEEVADPKNRLKTEDKLTQCAYVMLEDLTILDNANVHVNYMRSQLFSHFFQAYGDEFYFERNGVASYDNVKFHTEVKGVVKYRQGIRMGTRAELPEEPVIADERRCTIA